MASDRKNWTKSQTFMIHRKDKSRKSWEQIMMRIREIFQKRGWLRHRQTATIHVNNQQENSTQHD